MKKNPGQYQLLNSGALSSARAVRKLKRERLINELGIKRGAKLIIKDPDFVNTELGFKDETRLHTVIVGRCPQCGANGQHTLHVIKEPLGTESPRVRISRPLKIEYWISCSGGACEYRTPAFHSSQLAIQNWKVQSALVHS